MRRELRWLAAAAVALMAAAYATDAYVKAATPLYRWGAEWLIQGRPWQIESIAIQQATGGERRELAMTGEVRAHSWDPQSSATVEMRLQLAAVMQNPVVFWLLLVLVPAGSMRRRLSLLLLGVPVFALLEVATTSCQLVNPMVQAAAMLEGQTDPVTWSEHWSRFLEAGGRVVLEVSAALLCLSLLTLFERRPPAFVRHRLRDQPGAPI